MALRVKYALPVHRFLYGCAGFIVNFVVPIYIYTATNNLTLALAFFLAKYCASAVVAPAIRSWTRCKPLLLMLMHTLLFFAASLTLVFISFSYPTVLLIALLFALSEIFYNTSLNIIFAVTVPNSLATVIQMPFASGLLLAGIAELGIKLPIVPAFVVAAACLFLSLLPLIFIKNDIAILNTKVLSEEIKKPYRDVKRDFFHLSLGLFSGVAFEILPFYLVVNQGLFTLALPMLVIFRALQLIFIKVGDIFHKKGWYNIAMAVCPPTLAALLILTAIFKEQKAAYYLYAAVVAVFPLNFIPNSPLITL
ncbi:MAG: hypothetical protein WC292_00670 [Clostridia bacterium]